MNKFLDSEGHDEAARRLQVVAAALDSATTDLLAIIANMQKALADANMRSAALDAADNRNKSNNPKGG